MRLLSFVCSLLVLVLVFHPADAHAQLGRIKKKAREVERDAREAADKNKDFWFTPASNVNLQILADEFADLDLPSVDGNRNEQIRLPLDAAYLEGFLGAQYTEDVHYDPDSQANLMRELFGLNKRGTIDSEVTMFANRYPWRKTLELVGAVERYGAQAFQAGL